MIERLSRREDFRSLQREGRRSREEHLWLRFRPAERCRIGFALGKSLGSAVTRNRVRRRLRERLRVLDERGDLPVGHYLIGGRPGVEELTSADLEDELLRLLRRLP